MLLPRDDPQFRRNRERIVRDAEREAISLEWDLGVPGRGLSRRPSRDEVGDGVGSATLADVDDRFINRELSWLGFNDGSSLAAEPGIPLLERAKFCAITSSNLDEFFQVRVAALKDQVAAASRSRRPTDVRPRSSSVEIGERDGAASPSRADLPRRAPARARRGRRRDRPLGRPRADDRKR